MNDSKEPLCDSILYYLTDENNDEERKAFEQHLEECEKCRLELPALQSAWNSIPYEMEELEPPSDLKQQVFDSLFPADTTRKNPVKLPQPKRFPYARWASAVAAILVIAVISWNNWLLREEISSMKSALSSPAQVVQSYAMIPADPSMKTVKGNAWLIDNGSQKRLVVQMNGLSLTQGSQVYQVWLIHNGTRQNAGTFRVDTQFEQIGITLEPDPNGNQPRGKKVSGT